jgi:hypothetical protein
MRCLPLLAFSVWATAAVCAQETSPVDGVDRVRARLQKPPSKLTLQQRTPDFTVHIEKRRPMQDIFAVPAWATDPIGWQPPRIGFDLLSVFRSLKRGHDARRARAEVNAAVAQYCNGLPNLGAGVQLCDAGRH